MKLQQLRCLASIAQNELSITAAAEKLRTTQPAVSKQLKLLENELGFNIFERKGRTLSSITPSGQRVVAHALKIVRETQNIRDVSDEFTNADHGTLSIGTTHTQARYVLPPVIQAFREAYPDIRLHLHQGTSEQIAELAEVDRIDLAVVTGSRELFPQFVVLPWYRWHFRIIVPKTHPLASVQAPSLRELASHPIITYVFSLSGPSSLRDLFLRAGLEVDIALTAQDSDVIKTYVRLGLGVGIIAGVALDPKKDADLVAIDAEHLFPAYTTWIGFARGRLVRRYMYEFMQRMAPHLASKLVNRAEGCATQAEVDLLCAAIDLPIR